MDVRAYPNPQTTPPSPAVPLGLIADGIWSGGFKKSQDRTVQVSRPIGATYPNLFDRLTKLENFQFAAGRSFNSQDAIGDALDFMQMHPDRVPTLCNLQFVAGGVARWLRNTSITRVELVTKESALVVFGYTIVGGYWSVKL
jgi:hypothetical protein